MTCYRYALVKVKRFSDFDEAPILEMNTGLVDRCYATELIICEAVGAAAKVLRDTNGVTCSQRDLSAAGLPEAICILTQYRSTLFYVQTELEQRGLRTYLLHSSMDFDQQSRTILEFKKRKGVLVATNASAATGLALPQVDVVLFYDLPRSPMMLHQLLGRFWRVGRSTALNLIVLSRLEGVDPMADTILGRLRMFVRGE